MTGTIRLTWINHKYTKYTVITMMKRITSTISDVRGELFGFSIITIILFHYFENAEAAGFGGAASVITKIYNLALGSSGVEIFLFLSGMGLFYSLSGDLRLSEFYRKRLTRILPAYLVLGGAGWLILDILLQKTGWLRFLLDFSTLSFWTEGERMVWYISLILILYLFFPLLYRMVAIPDRRLAGALTVALTAAVMAGCLALYGCSFAVYDRIEIALWRVVPFILGAWCGRKVRSGQSFSAEAVILCGMGIAGILLTAVTKWRSDFLWGVFSLRLGTLFYPFAVMFAVAAVLSKCGGSRFLRFVGSISLELYLSHVIIRAILNEVGMKTCYPQYYLLCIALSVALSVAANRLFARRR